MADGEAPLVARVAPVQKYYTVIDGTPAQDSVEYGRLLETTFGFRNLLTEFLEPDPKSSKGDERLLDPNHPFLPICTFPAPGLKKPVAVVCPGGRHGQGLDAFWQNYIGETPEEQADHGKHVFQSEPGGDSTTTFGRQTAAIKSCKFIHDYILVPGIEKITENGKSFAQIKDGLLSGSRNPTEPDVFADLLIVSSHGWLGGFMRGDNPQDSKTAEPEVARKSFGLPTWFVVGRHVVEGGFFVGPKWIILAQCSTVNSATWMLWAKLMQLGIPPVRGILAYEEVSPGVSGSIDIAQNFMASLKQGVPMLKAWKKANAGQKWAAVVHKEAVDDQMTKWDVLPDIKETKLSATETSYLAFGASLKNAAGEGISKEVFDRPPPFGFKLEQFFPEELPDPSKGLVGHPAEFAEVTPDKLERRRAQLFGERLYRTTISPPAGTKITQATLRWIHIRETHSIKPAISTLFQTFRQPSPQQGSPLDLSVSDKDKRTLVAKVNGPPQDSIVIEWISQPDSVLEKSGLEHHHSFVWPLIRIDVVGGPAVDPFPFSTIGLLF